MITFLIHDDFTLSYLSHSRDYYQFLIKINSTQTEHIVDISKHYHIDTIKIALDSYKHAYETSGLTRDKAIYLAVYGLHDLIEMNELDTLSQLMVGVDNGKYVDTPMDESLANELMDILCSR